MIEHLTPLKPTLHEMVNYTLQNMQQCAWPFSSFFSVYFTILWKPEMIEIFFLILKLKKKKHLPPLAFWVKIQQRIMSRLKNYTSN